jgi:hypothetical protein
LFIALGGSAYAATAAKNTVTSKSIKPGAVKSTDVQDNGIQGIDVNEASLDFAGLPQLAGPAGPTGPKGSTGATGPTFASMFANPQDPVPPVTPDATVLNGQYSHTFTTPKAGRLLVFASLRVFGVNCSAGFPVGYLYLDGVGVPGSGQGLTSTTAPVGPYTPFALTGVVPAGQHTLRISYDCPDGNATGDTSVASGDLGALLIGG